MRLIVLHNPDAGDGSWTRRRVERLLHDAGYDAHVVKSKKKRKWREALLEDTDALVVAGGDGTVHKLVRAAEGRNLPIAILPIGTANNVAHALGYHTDDDLALRVRNWPANERSLNLAHVRAAGATRALVEVFGAGAFATMREGGSPPEEGDEPLATLLGVRRALARLVMRAPTVHVTARIDDTTVEGDYVLLECMNLPFYGPRLRLAPDAEPDSPLLTVAGVRGEQRVEFAHWINDGTGDPSAFFIGRGKRISLQADTATHVDGKVWPSDGCESFDIEGGARQLRMWV